MSEFIYDRAETTVIVLRVPKRVWDQWESRHKHFGVAIHRLREAAIDTMTARLVSDHSIAPDPFWVTDHE